MLYRSISITFIILCLYSAALAGPPAPCLEEIGTSDISFGTYVVATYQRNFFIKPGQCLVSPNRKTVAVLQASDGNFVLYTLENNAAKTPYWSSKTGGHQGAGLLVQQDGHLVIYRAGSITEGTEGPHGNQGQAIFESNAASNPFSNYLLAMQNDGNLVLYTGTNPSNINGHRFSAFAQMRMNAGGSTECTEWKCETDPTTGRRCSFVPSRC